jgi:hypothetical protein
MASAGFSLIMPYVVNMLPLSRINFRSKQLSFGNFNLTDSSTDTFISIQNNGGLGGVILYNNYTALKYVYEKDLSELKLITLQVTDDNNNELDFNNSNFFITVQFDINYIPAVKTSFESIIKGLKI